ncbi:hypothetical protein [Cohnella boryungensis]|uniref:Uncharacterized protein n=1 Tax=Cohnella boryungensis TaxID=768479 RepID=A0ABV8SFZ7_9BACL
MRVSSFTASSSAAMPDKASHVSPTERQIALLQKQMEALKENKQGAADNSEKIKQMEKQLGELQKMLNSEKLEETKREQEEMQQKMQEKAEQEAAQRQEPDQALFSRQARDMLQAQSDMSDLTTLRKVQSMLPTRKERENFAPKIVSKAMDIQKDMSQNIDEQSRLAQELPRFSEHGDLLHISATGRELAADAIQHNPARYWGSVELNAALEQTLQNQPEAVKTAVYTIIQDNFFPQGASELSQEQRENLLETGMAQAGFIGEQYISNPQDKELFLSTMRQIAATAKTGKLDPASGQMTYVQLPNRPQGAPDDYVDMQELMKRFDPQAYDKFQKALPNAAEALSVLLNFAKSTPRQPEWIKAYHKENEQLKQTLSNADVGNRFKDVDTSSLSAFVADMTNRLQQTGTSALTDNLLAFARILS